MPSKIVHDKCKCGNTKKITSNVCRDCYYKSLPKYACQSCGKNRKKTTNPICRDCFNSNRTERIVNDKTPIGETFYTHGSRNKYNYIRSHSRRLISTLGIKKICSFCRFNQGVQICHIKPISEYTLDTPLNEVNSLDNLILLCPNCHWLFDHGYPSLDDLKQFYKQVCPELNGDRGSRNT